MDAMARAQSLPECATRRRRQIGNSKTQTPAQHCIHRLGTGSSNVNNTISFHGEMIWMPRWTPAQIAAGHRGEERRSRGYFERRARKNNLEARMVLDPITTPTLSLGDLLPLKAQDQECFPAQPRPGEHLREHLEVICTKSERRSVWLT